MYKDAIMGAVSKVAAAIILLLSLIPAISSAPVALAVTVSYDTVPSPRGPVTVAVVTGRYYIVRSGDNISDIAYKFCSGQSRDWTGIYAASRKSHLTAWNANDLTVGQTLVISCAFIPGMLDRAPLPKPVYVAPATSTGDTPANNYQAPYQATKSATYSGGYSSSFEQCVIARESGGSVYVMNGTGHYGLYQFSASTWAAYGGNPASFGSAGAAEQRQVFLNAMAQGGQSNWSPYDGC